jgi:hypothetical protein
MKAKITLLILSLYLAVFSYGQKITLNQLDSNGKKDGTWIEYLSKKWKVLKDSNNAKYCRYVFYDHGKYILPRVFSSANKKLEFTGDTTPKTIPILLDGEYKWYDRKGRLLTDGYYAKGEYVWFKSYTWGIFNKKMTGQKIHENYDFTKKYNGQQYTFYLELSDKNGMIKYYFIRKDKYGWCAYEE